MKKVLVTGAAGFLGSHLTRLLHERGYEPVPADLPGIARSRLVSLPALPWVELDLGSPASIRDAVAAVRPDAVVHCAAYGVDYRQQDPQLALATNVVGTVVLVEAAADAGVQRFVHVGTCFEYGDKPHPITETETLEPASLYGATKAAGTLLALERARSRGLDLCVVRPFGMYGPLEGDHKLVPLIKRACATGHKLPLTAGEQVRDYIYVGDVARAIVHILEATPFPAGEIFNLGSSRPIRLRDFITACAQAFGDESLMDFGAVEYRPNEMWQLVADTGKWEKHFGHPLAQTSIAQGCALMKEQAPAARPERAGTAEKP